VSNYKLAWSKSRQQSGAVLHSSHKLGELLQCLKHDDSSINIIIVLLLLLPVTVISYLVTLQSGVIDVVCVFV